MPTDSNMKVDLWTSIYDFGLVYREHSDNILFLPSTFRSVYLALFFIFFPYMAFDNL